MRTLPLKNVFYHGDRQNKSSTHKAVANLDTPQINIRSTSKSRLIRSSAAIIDLRFVVEGMVGHVAAFSNVPRFLSKR